MEQEQVGGTREVREGGGGRVERLCQKWRFLYPMSWRGMRTYKPPRSKLQAMQRQTNPFGWHASLHKRGAEARRQRALFYVPCCPLQQSVPPLLLPVALCCAVWPFVAILSALYCNLQYFRFYFLMPRQGGQKEREGRGEGSCEEGARVA